MRKLFRRQPPDDLLDRVVQTLGFGSLDDRCEIDYKKIRKGNIEDILVEIYHYYTPCYARIFLKPDILKFMTVARQMLRLKGISILRRKTSSAYFYRLGLPTAPESHFEVSFD